MECFLIALDCQPGCVKIIDYMMRVLKGAENCKFKILHILPTASPDKLRMVEVQRIEHVHTTRPDLAGYFWREEDEKKMTACFAQAKEAFLRGGFPPESVTSFFSVEFGDVAEIILAETAEQGCSTVVLGRRHSSLVKELLLGSVSTSVIKSARGVAVWVIGI